MELEEAKRILNELKGNKALFSGGWGNILTDEEKEAIETVLRELEFYQEKVEKYKFMMSNDVIPKKKVKDKIKELGNTTLLTINDRERIEFTIKKLQELLENK